MKAEELHALHPTGKLCPVSGPAGLSEAVPARRLLSQSWMPGLASKGKKSIETSPRCVLEPTLPLCLLLQQLLPITDSHTGKAKATVSVIVFGTSITPGTAIIFGNVGMTSRAEVAINVEVINAEVVAI